MSFKRFRRLRLSENMRGLVRETRLESENFIYPLFIRDGEGIKNEVSSMPGVFQLSIDKAVEEIERRREAAGRGVEYKAFEMYFMQGMDYAEIAEQLDTGKNTPRRWVTGIINELSVLLWGIDEERVK